MQDTPTNTTHTRLFITRLAEGVAPAAVGETFKRIRERHRQLEVAGVLLFDGLHFGYSISGPVADVAAGFDAIEADPKQADLQLLCTRDGAGAEELPLRGWRSGWTEPDKLATLADANGPRGQAALQAWGQLLSECDLL